MGVYPSSLLGLRFRATLGDEPALTHECMVSAPMATRDADLSNLATDAAYASAERTIDAIDAAAAKNDDPEVARILDEAAVSADTTASRVSWLRQLIRRAFGGGASITP